MLDFNTSLYLGSLSCGITVFSKKTCYFLVVFTLFVFSGVFAQEQKVADSLAQIYKQNPLRDTARLELLYNLSFNEVNDYKQALEYAEELISYSLQGGNNKYLCAGYFIKGTKKRLLGNFDEALESFIKSAEIAKKLHNLTAEGDAYGGMGDAYSGANDHSNAKLYYNKGIAILRQSKESINLASALLNAGDEFRKTEKYDSALLFFEEAKIIFDTTNYLTGKAYSLGNIGMVYGGTGQNNLAEKNINEAIRILQEIQDYYPICDYLISMADIYLNKGDIPTALSYTSRSLQLAEQFGLKEQLANASLKLSVIYEKSGNFPAAFKYYTKHIAYRDSINNINNVRTMADLRTNFEVSRKQVEVNLLQEQKRNQKIVLVSLILILGLSIVILGISFKHNQNKQKAYAILNLQKQKTEDQKAKAEAALAELQVTQKQLIQTAKMASLGELTAGIAHEIQNPLNFVNNFSELSVDLLEELREGTVGKLTAADKAEANEIIDVLADNFKKISDHGKRADSIVKGMLQHSRTSTGNKEPTDINVLAGEYLRLSYHGLKAKDKEFASNFTTDFDESIGRVEVVPQDIGRVLLNLCNNAFYAVNKKKKRVAGEFDPLVTVTTKRAGNKVEIAVKDNGIGIPQHILDKIFQPFFTTKPTGQGTGLGLSLSYDIINALGGTLEVETKEGEFAKFIIQLPIVNNNDTVV